MVWEECHSIECVECISCTTVQAKNECSATLPFRSNTVNPRISPLGAYLFLKLFGWGRIGGEGLFEGELIKLFDKCRIKCSLSKLLFSIILQEQFKFKYYSLSKSSSSSGVGA